MKNTVSITATCCALLIGVAAVLLLESGRSASSASASAPIAVGEPAPDFSVETINGRQFSLAAHRGKPVVIFAMFGGCGECISVGRTLNRIQENYAARGVTVLAVDILDGEPPDTLKQYRDYIGAAFPFASYDKNLVQAYRLTAPEITYVIDKDDNIADINQNGLSYEQYKQQIEKAL